MLNPITLRHTGTSYELLAGRGRLAAARSLGWTHIPATITHCTNNTASAIRLAENVTRSNLSPIEEATQLQPLVEADPEGTIGVAHALGRSQAWVEDRLELLSWPPSLQQHVHTRKISVAAAKRLARIPDPTIRDLRINDAALHGISARTAALWLQDAITNMAPDSEPPEKAITPIFTTPQTQITTTCFACRAPVPIADTRSVRFCVTCLAQTIRDLRIIDP